MTEEEKARKLAAFAQKWGHSKGAAGPGNGDGGSPGGSQGGEIPEESRPGQRAPREITAGTGKKDLDDMARERASLGASESGRGGSRLPGLPEKDRTAPNKYENLFMIDLMLLRNSLRTRGPKVKDRLRKVNPQAGRDLGLLFSLVDRLQDQMVSTMPRSRDEYYATLARNGRYHMDIEGPIRQGHMVLITDTNLAYLTEVAVEQECLTCLRDGSEIRNCPLRKALIEVAPAMEIREDPGARCEYANVHRQLLHGEDVTI